MDSVLCKSLEEKSPTPRGFENSGIGLFSVREFGKMKNIVREFGKTISFGIREKTKYRSGIRENRNICSGIRENDFVRDSDKTKYRSGIRENQIFVRDS